VKKLGDNIVRIAIDSVNTGQLAYCKFLSANDTGDTGGHQSGIYIAKNAIAIMFDEPGVRGENKDRFAKIRWQNDFFTDSRFIYYGCGTRNEYRITRLGRDFPFLRTEHTGDLFVLVKHSLEEYSAYVLETEDDINEFLDNYGMMPTDTGRLIEKLDFKEDKAVEQLIRGFIDSLGADFPSTIIMSSTARDIYGKVYNHQEGAAGNPDDILIKWIDMEYHIFRRLEFYRYGDMISKGFVAVEDFIEVANTVLNRRKSRAGKSLENHLAALFDYNKLIYVSQPITEGNKKPDFLFPTEKDYHDPDFPSEKLVFLGAKTTCKDRWRQIINEANRIEHKHLFTLQQGISSQQMAEMEDAKITLVVPAQYINAYPKEKRHLIWTLSKFISYVRETTT
jgi:type II restriction enzyme